MTNPDQIDLSLVIPVWNEATALRQLQQELSAVLIPLNLRTEIIFADDGSGDPTWQTLGELVAIDPQVRAVRMRRHLGKSAALTAALKRARGEAIITLDGDLQDDPAELPKFLDKLGEGFDLVCGWKAHRCDPASKRWASRIFNSVVSAVTGLHLHDHNCGFRAMRRQVAREVKLYGELHRFLPVLADSRGFRVTEIEVNHRARPFGRSKFGFERYLRGAFDLFTVLLITHYRSRPLHLFGGLGLASFILGLLFLIPRLNLLSLWLCLSAVIFFCTGVIAELQVNAQPAHEEEAVAEELPR